MAAAPMGLAAEAYVSDITHQRLGKYELVTKLATGGMAELFLAREVGLAGLERLVVIKRILPHLADDPSFIEMFLREARIIARLNHPNVVQIFELGEEQGSYYIAMEYIHGSTVREMQVLAERKKRTLPVEVIVSIVDQACRGLHAAHELRDLEGNQLELIHRDVSPHNLMCTTEGYIKVLDFGVAKAAQGVEATNSGHLKGKFAYMSPEQCQGQDLDRRADIFSLGVVLWEALADRRLFKREKDLDMMRAVVQEEAEPPSLFNTAIPAAIDEVVLTALEKNREARFDSAETMRQALIEAARQSGLFYGEDRLAAFLSEVAGEELAERRATMRDAMERSLTSNERRNLLHVTGSDSRSALTDPGEDDPLATVVERPTGGSGSQSGSHSGVHRQADSGSHSGVRQTGSDSASLPPGVRPFDEPEPTSESSPEESAPTDDHADTRSGKRTLLIGALVGLLAAVALAAYFWPQLQQSSLGQAFGGDESDSPILIGDPIRIGWAPIATPDVLRKEIQPIRAYLESTLGRPVPMEVTDSYEALADGLRNGDYDVGMVPPLLYVRTKESLPDLDIVAIREFDGATSSDALLLTRMDASIHQLADLEGKSFCFTDKNSTSGNYLPRAYIRRQGFEPAEFIGEVVWSGNHLQVKRDLIAGKCDAAATYSGSFLTAEHFGIPVGRIRQLAITGHIPQDAVVVAPGASRSIVDELQEALLDFEPELHVGAPKVGEILQITGFSAGSDDAFEDLRRVIQDNEALPAHMSPDAGKARAED
jgi:eukaryotic-like serine/threonine-protein kinase